MKKKPSEIVRLNKNRDMKKDGLCHDVSVRGGAVV